MRKFLSVQLSNAQFSTDSDRERKNLWVVNFWASPSTHLLSGEWRALSSPLSPGEMPPSSGGMIRVWAVPGTNANVAAVARRLTARLLREATAGITPTPQCDSCGVRGSCH
jgi:hypothetical protein